MKHKRMKTTRLLYCIILIAFHFAFYSNATDWYVDNEATAANNGTSWEDAWQSFADIEWNSIQPGDTIFISGGTTEKTYNEPLFVGASGSEGKPITIKVGQVPGHNGNVIITSDDSFGGLRIYFDKYITVDGNVNGERKLTIYHCSQAGIWVNEPRRVYLTNINIYENGRDHVWSNDGLMIRIDDYTDFDNRPYLDVSNCHFKENWQDAIHGGSGQAALGFGYVKIHDNILENTADDGIEIGMGGVDIYNNDIFGLTYNKGHGHPDAVAFVGGEYYRVYNNKLHDLVNGNGYIYFEYDIYPGESLYPRPINHIYIYNNLVYESIIRLGRVTKYSFYDVSCAPYSYDYDREDGGIPVDLNVAKAIIEDLVDNGYLDIHGFIQPAFYSLSDASEMILDPEYENNRQEIYDIIQRRYDDGSALRGIGFEGKILDTISNNISNVVIANNVVVNMPRFGLSVGFIGVEPEGINNVIVANNIIHNCPTNPGRMSVMFADFKEDRLLGSYGSGARVIFDNNIISAGDEGATDILILKNWGEPSFFITYDELVNTYGLNINGANIDPFLDSEYKPDSETDPTVDAGMDLSEFFDFDLAGISRPQGSAWDIGAYEYNTGTNIHSASTENKENFRIYPNPFRTQTTIEYKLSEQSEINILLYEINGRTLKTIYSGVESKGLHSIELSSRDLPPGIYLIKLINKNSTVTKKCLIIK